MKCQYCGTQHDFLYCPKCGNLESKEDFENCHEERIDDLALGLSVCDDKGKRLLILVAYRLSACFEALKSTGNTCEEAIFKKKLEKYRNDFVDSFNSMLLLHPYVHHCFSKKWMEKSIQEDGIKDQRHTQKSSYKTKRKDRMNNDPTFGIIDEEFISLSSLILEKSDVISNESMDAAVLNKDSADEEIIDKRANLEKFQKREEDEAILLKDLPGKVLSDETAKAQWVLLDEEDEFCPVQAEKYTEDDRSINAVNSECESNKIEIGQTNKQRKKKRKAKNNELKNYRAKEKTKARKKKIGKRKCVVVDPEGNEDYDGYYDDVQVLGEAEKSFEQIVISENAKTLVGLGIALFVGIAFIIYGIMSAFS